MTKIDVSECRNYSFKEFINFTECPDYCADYLDGICSSHPDCYYRQLKRLEAENAKLKEALENVRNYLELTGILFDNELLLDTNAQRAVDVINEVLEDE